MNMPIRDLHFIEAQLILKALRHALNSCPDTNQDDKPFFPQALLKKHCVPLLHL